ncbi:MAG: hypothetical protein J2P15_20750, partial [Micromonosporaceae bacterium]|nr:hypothetical protein [Micromonosporaceae bacterium]
MPEMVDLLRTLDGDPYGPSRVDIRRAIAEGRRRRRIRRGVGYAGTAAVAALVVAGGSVGTALITHARPQAGAATAKASVSRKAAYTIPGTKGWRPAAATAPASCTLSRLPAPGNAPMALVAGADPTGRYIVGRSYPKRGQYQAVIWHDGAGQNVMLPGDLEELLEDVNSSGTAVGWSYAESGPIPYVYSDGKVSQLPGVQHGEALAINGAG